MRAFVTSASPKNVGAAANHNLLVPMTDSPYFKWAAHDDLLAPGFLAACVDVLDRDPPPSSLRRL
jgi:GT2 family glycosyltransferase